MSRRREARVSGGGKMAARWSVAALVYGEVFCSCDWCPGWCEGSAGMGRKKNMRTDEQPVGGERAGKEGTRDSVEIKTTRKPSKSSMRARSILLGGNGSQKCALNTAADRISLCTNPDQNPQQPLCGRARQVNAHGYDIA